MIRKRAKGGGGDENDFFDQTKESLDEYLWFMKEQTEACVCVLNVTK